MENVDLDSSVPDWLVEYPSLLSLFRELGIDYCCGGKSLRTASEEQGLRPEDVLASCEHAAKNPSEKRD